jgi:hypothetical protein
VHATDDQIIVAIEELIAANRDARRIMLAGEAVLERGIERLRQGEKVTETLSYTPAGEQRGATEAANRRIAVARHDLRMLLIGRCLDEGMRPWEVANAWGMSRQRVDRYIQEMKRTSADADDRP